MAGVSLVDHVRQLLQDSSGLDEVKSLPYNEMLNQAEASALRLQAFSDGAKSWTTPFAVNEKAEALKGLLEEFDLHHGNLKDYAEHAASVAKRLEREKASVKKAWRSARDNIKCAYTRQSVAPAVAKLGGIAVQSATQDPSEVGLPDCLYHVPFPAAYDHTTLQDVVLLRDEDKNQSDFHKELKAFMEPDWENIITKGHDMANVLRQKEKSHCISTLDATRPFNFVPGTHDIMDIEGPPYKKHVVGVLEHFTFDVGADGMPLQGVAMFITCVEGCLQVAVAQEGIVQKGGGDFAAWLGNSDAGALDQCPNFVLGPKDSCWIPFGCIPLITGFAKPSPNEGAKKKNMRIAKDSSSKQFSTFAIVPCFSKKHLDAPANIVGRVLSSLNRCDHFFPPSLAKSESYDGWLGKLAKKRQDKTADDKA